MAFPRRARTCVSASSRRRRAAASLESVAVRRSVMMPSCACVATWGLWSSAIRSKSRSPTVDSASPKVCSDRTSVARSRGGAQLRLDRLAEHHLHLGGHAGQAEEAAPAEPDGESRRGAGRVPEHLAAAREIGLAEVGRGGPAPSGRRKVSRMRRVLSGSSTRSAPHAAAKHSRVGSSRVGPRPPVTTARSARAADLLDRRPDVRAAVADGGVPDDVEAEQLELFGEKRRVRVGDAPGHQLAADREDLRVHAFRPWPRPARYRSRRNPCALMSRL